MASNSSEVLQIGFIINKRFFLTLFIGLFFSLGYRLPASDLFLALGIQPLTYILAGVIAITISFILKGLLDNKIFTISRYISIGLFAGICSYLIINYLTGLLCLTAQMGVIFSSYCFATAAGNTDITNNSLGKNYLTCFTSSSDSESLENKMNFLSLTNSNNNSAHLV